MTFCQNAFYYMFKRYRLVHWNSRLCVHLFHCSSCSVSYGPSIVSIQWTFSRVLSVDACITSKFQEPLTLPHKSGMNVS